MATRLMWQLVSLYPWTLDSPTALISMHEAQTTQTVPRWDSTRGETLSPLKPVFPDEFYPPKRLPSCPTVGQSFPDKVLRPSNLSRSSPPTKDTGIAENRGQPYRKPERARERTQTLSWHSLARHKPTYRRHRY